MDLDDLELEVEELKGKVWKLQSSLYFLAVCFVFLAGLVIALYKSYL